MATDHSFARIRALEKKVITLKKKLKKSSASDRSLKKARTSARDEGLYCGDNPMIVVTCGSLIVFRNLLERAKKCAAYKDGIGDYDCFLDFQSNDLFLVKLLGCFEPSRTPQEISFALGKVMYIYCQFLRFFLFYW